MKPARSVPARSRTSMRESCPCRSNSSCAAPMSITASALPPALTVPPDLASTRRRPLCSRSGWSAAKACRAAGLRKTMPGANKAKRSPPCAGTGTSPGATEAITSASTPATRMGLRSLLAVMASVEISSTGLAADTCSCAATRAKSVSSRLPCTARNSRSGCPPAERTALENSLSAEALIKCTENASATPSITASAAAALRHGWWRSSCQEKVRSRADMRALCVPPRPAPPPRPIRPSRPFPPSVLPCAPRCRRAWRPGPACGPRVPWGISRRALP